MPEQDGLAGRYLYCVAESGDTVDLGDIGIDGSCVYTIPFKDICAVVHDCDPAQYKSEDQDRLERWIIAHQLVVERAWSRWGSVLPSSFTTILGGDPGKDASRSIQRWLEEDYERLKEKIVRVRGKAEYGVQVFWDPRAVARKIVESCPEIMRLDEEIRAAPRGRAYMYRQKLEGLLRKEMEAGADQLFKECYGRARKHADDIRVDKLKKQTSDGQMIANLSCLVTWDNYAGLGQELEEINQMKGVSVRFTGPWPPYSFVS